MPRPSPEYPSRDAYTTRAATHDDALLDAPTALDPPRVTDETLATWPEEREGRNRGGVLADEDAEPVERSRLRLRWWLRLGLALLALVSAGLVGWLVGRGGA